MSEAATTIYIVELFTRLSISEVLKVKKPEVKGTVPNNKQKKEVRIKRYKIREK